MRGFFDLPKNAKCVQMGTFGDFRDARKVCAIIVLLPIIH